MDGRTKIGQCAHAFIFHVSISNLQPHTHTHLHIFTQLLLMILSHSLVPNHLCSYGHARQLIYFYDKAALYSFTHPPPSCVLPTDCTMYRAMPWEQFHTRAKLHIQYTVCTRTAFCECTHTHTQLQLADLSLGSCPIAVQ